jgi:hypothetical protein
MAAFTIGQSGIDALFFLAQRSFVEEIAATGRKG